MSGLDGERRLPRLTAAARASLRDRAVVLRTAARNGCCGGQVRVPVAEFGPPVNPAGYHRLEHEATVWYVEPDLLASAGRWELDAVGIGRWRRLQLDGAEALPATGA
ncbi:CC/Se motif family (seleno)protein [Egicoccus halophilus]|uniref:Uncharacterized protein n=1 Tax=Egicoccus halophilus TaxID=1670830 RepID=A0A8J3AGJ7_9ACTN|nr:CC/Se motif family (seleno)protein [Egicoccus halophilus]GGI08947.1 hypothetical protein GCM10011354_31630 [Egicoccus halophilus]